MKAIASSITLLGILSYLAGWLYLYYYLWFFGFSIFEVDVPFHYFLVYAFPVFASPLVTFDPLVYFVAAIVLAFIVLLPVVFGPSIAALERKLAWVYGRATYRKPIVMGALISFLGLVVIVFVLTATLALARTSALQAATAELKGQAVHLLFKDSFKESLQGTFSDNSEFPFHLYLLQEDRGSRLNHKVFLVFSDKKNHFLFLATGRLQGEGVGLSVSNEEVLVLGRGRN